MLLFHVELCDYKAAAHSSAATNFPLQSLDMSNILTFDPGFGHCLKFSCQICPDLFELRTLRTAFAIDS